MMAVETLLSCTDAVASAVVTPAPAGTGPGRGRLVGVDVTHPTYALALALSERDERRFRAKVGPVRPDGCRLWEASTDADDYGQFFLSTLVGRRTVKAHLVAWHLERGEFPPGLEPDHTCNIRHCTEVDHLEWVTHEENNRRIGLRATHCRAGKHRWDEQQPLMRGHGRECRPCRNEHKRIRYARNREAS